MSADERQVGGSHYKDMPVQPWAVMQSVLTPEEFRGFLKGNIIKYGMRSGRKDGTDDSGKLQHYMEKLKEVQA
ncbi:SaV-like [uncultured Caudovirales phage]|uniref:SaV-like n=1 Tax=uncultured Caudovirales phage TaxID=2100421 RepID=A0A6J7XQX4_9CAUD|nr:SaV-like [uncultured Caudovirales phage]